MEIIKMGFTCAMKRQKKGFNKISEKEYQEIEKMKQGLRKKMIEISMESTALQNESKSEASKLILK